VEKTIWDGVRYEYDCPDDWCNTLGGGSIKWSGPGEDGKPLYNGEEIIVSATVFPDGSKMYKEELWFTRYRRA
jgi:hypothetical protein